MTAFFFDVDDTLYDQLEPFRLACEQIMGAEFETDYERLFVRSRYYSELVFNRSESGQMAMEDMYIYRLVHAFADLGMVLEPQKALQLQRAYGKYQGKIRLLPGMADLLAAARNRGALLGVITNGPSGHQRDKIRALGLEQWIGGQHMFISAEMGMAKPDARVFKQIQDELALDPANTYYIGDSFANDVAGAWNAGWRSVWFNRRRHSIPRTRSQSLLPDFTVYSVKELHELIMRIAE